MSIRHSLLALLESGPMYGYQLRTEFESRTGGTWPLNVGQVYTTLARLERDRLVESITADAEGQQHYRLTDLGRSEVRGWFRTPVDRTAPPRDELAIKLALALTTPGVAVEDVVRRQRTATVRTLQDYTRLKTRADESGDIAWLLVLDSLVFQAEAEVRWLDHCEARLARYRPDRTHSAPAQTLRPVEQPAGLPLARGASGRTVAAATSREGAAL